MLLSSVAPYSVWSLARYTSYSSLTLCDIEGCMFLFQAKDHATFPTGFNFVGPTFAANLEGVSTFGE